MKLSKITGTAAVLFLAALYCSLWVLSSSSMAFTECAGQYALFASNPRCRQPHLAATLAALAGGLAVVLLWLGMRLRRRSRGAEAHGA